MCAGSVEYRGPDGAANLATAPTVETEQASDTELAYAITVMTRNAIEAFNLAGTDVAAILGVSPSYLSKLRRNPDVCLDADSYAYKHAVLLMRAIEALTSIVGDRRAVRDFLYSAHASLEGRPIDLMTQPEGIVDVTRYLESFSH